MCTLEKRGEIFFLTLTGDDDHRLNPSLMDSLRSALREVKEQSTRGSALITTARGKFFSNGFDLAWAQSAGSAAAVEDRLLHLVDLFKPEVADLISLPMPTIAAVTGHAAAAGMMLAMSHDYVLMRSDRGVLYMSELDIGMKFPDYFTALVRSKVGSAAARRDVMLRAKKVTASEALAMGIVDSAHDSAEAVVEAAVRLGEELVKRKWDGEVYGEIRKALYPELCGVLGLADKAVITSPRHVPTL
ncbi:Enoyl-CoA delta isomerase 2, peroxisomal like [Actinidia chinensis var. chinensis]|uniref:Delta(3)-Delta(2)-enoyl-CoA isomerase n=1 Tax=Actinidia chinensis var. chinensis TaxID=1590841 RepID=A0A2R6RY03_ACTCC|nr:Enoyl-CoA delta isomerase 2, peroxisomal like [Actinidia chinensis var. chinensis]